MEPSYLYERSPLRLSGITLRRPEWSSSPGSWSRTESTARQTWPGRTSCKTPAVISAAVAKRLQITSSQSALFVHLCCELIAWHSDAIAKVTELWKTSSRPQIPKAAAHTMILLCCWEIWKHRRDVVFRGLQPDHGRLVAACRKGSGLAAYQRSRTLYLGVGKGSYPRNPLPIHHNFHILTSKHGIDIQTRDLI